MKTSRKRWSLGAKLALVGLPFLVLGLLITATTLWVSWQLDGGAAAVNEAGRVRMEVYRLAWLAGRHDGRALREQLDTVEDSLSLLRNGDPVRPLEIPWNAALEQRYGQVRQQWQAYRKAWPPAALAADVQAAEPEATAALIRSIDALVLEIEQHLSQTTSLLHLLQLALLVSGVMGAATLILTGYRFVLEPVGALRKAIEVMRRRDLSVRVEATSNDEFGDLARGFNAMAGELQLLYQNLESRVSQKTAELEVKRERLEVLLDVSTLASHSASLQELAAGFAERVRKVLHADGIVLRWASEDDGRFVMLASEGLPTSLIDREHCIQAGDCHCGVAADQLKPSVIAIQPATARNAVSCHAHGFTTAVTIPIRHQDRLLGELDLFFHARHALAEADEALIDALTAQLARGVESLRLNALEKEAAVAEERGFLARELHDSIAQSLAFLKIQASLMRDAMARTDLEAMRLTLEEIELGVRESHGDVRELLMHFRTRTNDEDIEPALRTTLRKFEHQTQIATELTLHGQGLPLPPDIQIQALHIVQEALSNVRKHARATRVWLDVWRQPDWRFEVRDDGIGFDAQQPDSVETSVGLRIMSERAERLGARFSVESVAGKGTRVRLTLAPQPTPRASRPPLDGAQPALH